jgi:hypothetical protein
MRAIETDVKKAPVSGPVERTDLAVLTANRGDATPVELFVAGVPELDSAIQTVALHQPN